MTKNNEIKDIHTHVISKLLILKKYLNEKQFKYSREDNLLNLISYLKEHLIDLSIDNIIKEVENGDEEYIQRIEFKIEGFSNNLRKLYLEKDYAKESDAILFDSLEDIYINYRKLDSFYQKKISEIIRADSEFYLKRKINKLELELDRVTGQIINLEESESFKLEFYKDNTEFLRKEISTFENAYRKKIQLNINLEIEKSEKENFKKRINNVISTLGKKTKKLESYERYIQKHIFTFQIISGIFFLLALFSLTYQMYYIYYNFGYTLSLRLNFTNYLMLSISIIFPTIVGFIFLRQSNLKQKEIYNITKRFILMEEINKSLNALVDISNPKELNNKTEKIIERLIDNTIHFVSNGDDEKSNQDVINLTDINSKFDSVIDTVEKKKTLLN